MGKQKSSASSATRKKHARKAAGTQDGDDQSHTQPHPKGKQPREKGGGKSSKKSKNEPRKKVYIPPTRPTPVRPDPLDNRALAATLPPDLVVLLRGLGKKARETKVRSLEDFGREWVEPARKSAESAEVLGQVAGVWVSAFR
jgi:hypothetical protein